MNGRDPGWKPALRPLVRLFLPWRSLLRKDERITALDQLRSFWLASPLFWALFLFVLGFIVPWSGPAGWWPLIICSVGVVTVIRIAFVFRRPLTPSREDSIKGAYTARFFLGWALMFYPTLAGFIATFAQDARWLYAIGIPFAAAGWLIVTPSERNIRMDENRAKQPILDALLESPDLL